MKISQCFGLVLMIALAGLANAGIIGTYVDATSSNTMAYDGISDWIGVNDGSVSDNLWRERTDESYQSVIEGGTIWQGEASNAENPIEIKTILTGLVPGTLYDISVVYAGHNAADQDHEYWNVAAGFTAGNLKEFEYGDGVSVETGKTALTVITQLQAPVGTIAADENGEIAVYIDRIDSQFPSGYSARACYDGLAYSVAEVPEPSTLVLLLGGILGFAAIGRHSKK